MAILPCCARHGHILLFIFRTIDKDGNKKLIGDVDLENVIKKVKAITPVPGGVGPMTIAYLMKNTIKAANLK